jgi:glutathione peroxidase-family protein
MRFLLLILLLFSSFAYSSSDWAQEQKRVVNYKLIAYCKQFFSGEKLKEDLNTKKLIAMKFCKGDFESPACGKTRGIYNVARKKYSVSLGGQKELGTKLDKHRTVLHLKEKQPYSDLCGPIREQIAKAAGQKE